MIRGVSVTLLLTGGLFPLVGSFSLAVAGALASAVILTGDFARSFRLPVAALVGVLTLGLIAATQLVHPAVGLYGETKSGQLWLTMFSAVAAGVILTWNHLVRFAYAWVAAALALALTAGAGINAGGRAVGLGESNPIWLARAIALGIVIVSWLVWTHRLRVLPGAALALALTAGVVATGSRGPLLAAVVGGLVVILADRGDHRYQRFVATLGGVLAVLIAVVYLPSAGQDATQGSLFDPAREVSGQSRLSYWQASVDHVAESPTGTGLGGWSTVTGFPAVYPHNLFLEVLVELGWLVGSAISVAVIVILVLTWRARRLDPAVPLVLAMLVAETVSVSVSGDVNARTFWFMFALAVATLWQVRQIPAEHDSTRERGPVAAPGPHHPRRMTKTPHPA